MEKNPSIGWERLLDAFYRTRHIINWNWFSDYVDAYCFGLSVCVLQFQNSLQCYDYLGKLIWKLDLDVLPSNLIKIQFDKNENLVVVLENRIRTYFKWSPLQWKDTLLPGTIDDTIWDYHNGCIILKFTQNIYKMEDDQLVLVCENNGQFNLLTKYHWCCKNDTVIILNDINVIHIDLQTKVLEKVVIGSSWQMVKISEQRFVCLFDTKYNKLRIYHKDPSKILMEQILDEIPTQIEWCGNDAIACFFSQDNEIKLYGPQGSYVTFWYPDKIIAIESQIDGIRIFTDKSIHFVSKVQHYTSKIFRIGSTESSAILLDSLDLLSNHATKAIENLKVIDLKQALLECLEAARDELDPYWQKKLLAAVSFGKDSLVKDSFDSDEFVKVCNLLRVLNMLRQMGIFITLAQYQEQRLDGILLRLLNLHYFYECVQICDFLNHKEKFPKIFKYWAITKIQLSPELDDDELYQLILKKSQSQTLPLQMASIGKIAFAEGRFLLARKLALNEPLPFFKLQLLLDMDEYELAVKEAKNTQNSEIIISLLLQLREKLTISQFTKLIIMVLNDDNLFTYYSREDFGFQYDFYQQTDQYLDLGRLIYEQGKKKKSLVSFLPQIESLYEKVSNSSVIKGDKELITRQLSLVNVQKDLTSQYNIDFMELTMDETLSKLIEYNHSKQINKFINLFKISDKKYYHIKCKKLSQLKRFDDLYKFSKEKKSPIGYMPFYKYVLEQGNKGEASLYIPMISDISNEEKLNMYLECKSYYEAIQLATKDKNIQGLKNIYEKIPSNEPQLKTLVYENMNKL